MNFRNRLAMLRGDRRGVSAVEFALIAPLLILLYFGSVHVTLALSADRKLTSSASMVADLVAQAETVDAGMIEDIFQAGQALVQPFAADPLAMRITSVRADGNGVALVEWSEGRGMAPRGPGDVPSVPAGVLLPDGGVIVVEASYPYETPFTGVKFGSFTFTETVYMRPRRSPFVAMESPPAQAGQASQGGGAGGAQNGGNGGGNGPPNGLPPQAAQPAHDATSGNNRGRGRG